MKCPFCLSSKTKVTNKRNKAGAIRRRRECLKCGKRFTTIERHEPVELVVVKKDGRREKYVRDKIFLGILKACEKRPISHEQVEKIINWIEEKIRKKGKKEIQTKYIGEEVIKKLKKLDKVAYIRFASVYRDFKDLNDFKRELKEVK